MKVQVSSLGLPLGNEPPDHHSMAQDRGEVIDLDLPEEATVDDVLQRFGGQPAEVQKVLVNGEEADGSTRLKDGDAVALVGQVSGL